MARPKSLTEFHLIPGQIILDSDEFETGFMGTVDKEGRIPKVGKEYAGRGVYIFIEEGK
jgi:hypothetical protein